MALEILKHYVETEICYNGKVKREYVMKELSNKLKLSVEQDDYEIKVKNIVKGERDYNVIEVFDTMYKEFAQTLEPHVYDRMDIMKELSKLYDKHKKHLQSLENG